MSFFKKHPVLTALILGAILILFIGLTAGREMSKVESDVGGVISPPSSAFSRLTSSVGSWFRVVFGVSDIQQEVATLRERNAELESELAGRREQELENERLKVMLKLVEDNPDKEYIAARVVGKSPGYWFSNFSINQGRNQGLKVGDVVINAEGALVGRLSEVGGNWSKVESIIDPNSNISAIIERTRDDVMVRGMATVSGNNNDRICEIYTLPLDNDLQPGDMVVSSGLGRMGNTQMPKGIPIGKVISVDISSSSIERTALLEPVAGFTSLEEVLVIVQAADSKKKQTATQTLPPPVTTLEDAQPLPEQGSETSDTPPAQTETLPAQPTPTAQMPAIDPAFEQQSAPAGDVASSFVLP